MPLSSIRYESPLWCSLDARRTSLMFTTEKVYSSPFFDSGWVPNGWRSSYSFNCCFCWWLYDAGSVILKCWHGIRPHICWIIQLLVINYTVICHSEVPSIIEWRICKCSTWVSCDIISDTISNRWLRPCITHFEGWFTATSSSIRIVVHWYQYTLFTFNIWTDIVCATCSRWHAVYLIAFSRKLYLRVFNSL